MVKKNNSKTTHTMNCFIKKCSLWNHLRNTNCENAIPAAPTTAKPESDKNLDPNESGAHLSISKGTNILRNNMI